MIGVHPPKELFQKKLDSAGCFWVRVLGLSLQLWKKEIMKKIEEECGGWLENEEETELIDHLRWACTR